MQCYQEFETGGSECETSAEGKKAHEHQKELWTTWLSHRQRGRGLRAVAGSTRLLAEALFECFKGF